MGPAIMAGPATAAIAALAGPLRPHGQQGPGRDGRACNGSDRRRHGLSLAAIAPVTVTNRGRHFILRANCILVEEEVY